MTQRVMEVPSAAPAAPSAGIPARPETSAQTRTKFRRLALRETIIAGRVRLMPSRKEVVAM